MFGEHRQTVVGSEYPRVSVIIPVYNGGELFQKCLESLAHADPQPSVVVVVADGDTDGSRLVAEKFGARVIARSVPGGPALARNLGARAVRKTDILFFMDADVTVSPGTIGEISSIFRNEPTIAALIGSYDDKPAEMNFYSQFKNLFHHYVHQTAREDASTFWGACGAIRHEVFQAVGGFNERYRRSSIEDIELGYRLKRAGYRIRLSKNVQVKHLKYWSALSVLKSDFFDRALPWTELIHRERRLINDLNLKSSDRMSVFCIYGLLITGLSGVWLPGLLTLSVGFGLALLTLNAPVYQFFQRKRGLWFALRSITWHWFYYLYSGLAFAVGTGFYWISSCMKKLSRSFSPQFAEQWTLRRRHRTDQSTFKRSRS